MIKLDIDPEALLEVFPDHDYESCDDLNFQENHFFHDGDTPICQRCAVLHKLYTGDWPPRYTDAVSHTIRETVNASRKRR